MSAEIAAVATYSAGISGAPLEEALDEQRDALWGAGAIIDIAVAALEREFGAWPTTLPDFPRALRLASVAISNATGALEAGPLEDRCEAIARAKNEVPL
jgi:hypothetical protein